MCYTNWINSFVIFLCAPLVLYKTLPLYLSSYYFSRGLFFLVLSRVVVALAKVVKAVLRFHVKQSKALPLIETDQPILPPPPSSGSFPSSPISHPCHASAATRHRGSSTSSSSVPRDHDALPRPYEQAYEAAPP